VTCTRELQLGVYETRQGLLKQGFKLFVTGQPGELLRQVLGFRPHGLTDFRNRDDLIIHNSRDAIHELCILRPGLGHTSGPDQEDEHSQAPPQPVTPSPTFGATSIMPHTDLPSDSSRSLSPSQSPPRPS